MKRSWIVDALMVSSVSSAALLLFSFVNDALGRFAHSYLVPVTFTGTLWNVVGLLPTPAALVGLLPYVSSDPLLTPHHHPLPFVAVQIMAALLCLGEAYGLRRHQAWALYAVILFLPVDVLVQASFFSAALRMDWPAIKELHGQLAGLFTFLAVAKRMILKLCIDAGCAAALLLGGCEEFFVRGKTLASTGAVRPLSPHPQQRVVGNHSWVAAVSSDARWWGSNRIVCWCAVSCVGVLLLFVMAKPVFPATGPGQYDIYNRLLPPFLLAALDYGLVAWHTRRKPEGFGLGLACACSLGVSAAGFVAAPVSLFVIFLRPREAIASAGGSPRFLALLMLVFMVANFVMLFGAARSSWLAREYEARWPMHWTLGFLFPFAMLFLLRAMASH